MMGNMQKVDDGSITLQLKEAADRSGRLLHAVLSTPKAARPRLGRKPTQISSHAGEGPRQAPGDRRGPSAPTARSPLSVTFA
ncbi:MAG: hypothetical protein ACLU3I_02955 [Acutalibacteraceae bacterium]